MGGRGEGRGVGKKKMPFLRAAVPALGDRGPPPVPRPCSDVPRDAGHRLHGRGVTPLPGDQTCASSRGCGGAAGPGCPGRQPLAQPPDSPVCNLTRSATCPQGGRINSGFPRPLPPWNGPWGHGSLVTDFSARRQHSGCSERGAAQPRLLGTDAPRLWGCPQELPLFGLIPVWTPDFLCEQSTQKEKNLERREAGGGRGRHLHSGTRRPGFFLVRGRWRSFWEPLRVYFYLPTNWSLIRKKTLG